MLEIPLKLFTFNLEYLRLQVQDIPSEAFSQAAFPGGKPPLWILGHLAIANDYSLQLLGEPAACPPEWHATFGPGSAAEVAGGPAAEDLLAELLRGAELVKQAVPRATPERLAQKHTVPMKQLLRFTPTVGDLVGHLLSTHFATHLGQLSVWRRQRGLPAVF
jgi:hypothetical protein